MEQIIYLLNNPTKMKAIKLLIVLLISSIACSSQMLHVVAGQKVGETVTVAQSIHLNFLNEYRVDDDYHTVGDWIHGINYHGTGAWTETDVDDIQGANTTVDFVVGASQITTATGAPDGGADPSADNVYCKQYVAGMGWRFVDGGTFQLTGLPANRGVRLYFLSNAFNWEASTVTFTANTVTSASVNSASNTGTCAGTWSGDAALRMVQCTTNGSGEVNISCAVVSGSTWITLNSLYIEVLAN